MGSKFAFDHSRAKDSAEQKALLEKLDERVSPAFAHDKRGGEDFEIVRHELRGLDDVEPAVSASIRDGVGALYISGEPLLYTNMGRVLPLVMASGKPTIGTYPEWGRATGSVIVRTSRPRG